MPRSPTSTTLLQAKALLQLVDLGGERGRIGGVALKHLDRDRPASAVAQQAVDDLRAIGPVVAAVAELGEFAVAAFEIGRADVVEHQHAVPEMPARQAALDARLLGAEPVQGGVEPAPRRRRDRAPGRGWSTRSRGQ